MGRPGHAGAQTTGAVTAVTALASCSELGELPAAAAPALRHQRVDLLFLIIVEQRLDVFQLLRASRGELGASIGVATTHGFHERSVLGLVELHDRVNLGLLRVGRLDGIKDGHVEATTTGATAATTAAA